MSIVLLVIRALHRKQPDKRPPVPDQCRRRGHWLWGLQKFLENRPCADRSGGPEGKDQIRDWISQLKPKHNKILDIAVGEGTYLNLFKEQENLKGCEWYGVEVWEPWVPKYKLNEIYDHFYLEDVRTFDYSKVGNVDLTFAGDIIEHMKKEEALDLYKNLLEVSDTLIMSIPIIYMPQGPDEGNPYEVHVKPDWSHQEVLESFPEVKDCWAGRKIGVYLLQKWIL